MGGEPRRVRGLFDPRSGSRSAPLSSVSGWGCQPRLTIFSRRSQLALASVRAGHENGHQVVEGAGVVGQRADLPSLMAAEARPGDLVLVMGAQPPAEEPRLRHGTLLSIHPMPVLGTAQE